MRKITFKFKNNKLVSLGHLTAGFTLIEMLISVAILAIITGFGVVNLTSYKNRHSFDLDTKNVLEAIRNAENKSILGDQGTGWGIKFTSNVDNGYFEIFSGNSYATSSVAVTQYLSSASRFSNPPPGFSRTIVFGQITGVPDASQMITLKTVTGSDSSITSLGSKGALNQLAGKNLVGYWPLDEGLGTTAYDASGGGNNGTLQNNPAWQTTSACVSGQCLNFNGSTNYISVASPNNIPSGNSSYTISAWIRPNAYGIEGIIGWGTWGVTNAVNAFRLTGSGLVNYWWANDLTVTVSGLTDGNWHHVLAEFDGTTRSIYVDSILVGSDTPTNHNAVVSDFKIGSTYNGEYFNGLIDDVRVYNRALSTTEVKTLYESY